MFTEMIISDLRYTGGRQFSQDINATHAAVKNSVNKEVCNILLPNFTMNNVSLLHGEFAEITSRVHVSNQSSFTGLVFKSL